MTLTVLNFAKLKPGGGLRRDPVLPEHMRGPDHDALYDADTLVYDAFCNLQGRKVHFICPPLLNLKSLLRSAAFTIDGHAVAAPKILQRPRHDELVFRFHGAATHWQLKAQDFSLKGSITPNAADLFEDLNCAVFISRNNDLRWIRDWARYHVAIHGLEGLVVFDNASSAYTAQDIADTLTSVTGLKRFKVVAAPLPFGPHGLGGRSTKALFLQSAVLNIARLKYFPTARAVLCCDCDELVAPIPGTTIFDLTRRSWLGYSLFRGRWLSAPNPGNGFTGHAQHTHSRADDMCRNTKYCIAPGGLVGFSHWDVHGAVKGFLKDRMTRKDVLYWHCRHLSTGWKTPRRLETVPGAAFDSYISEVFERALPPV